MGPAMKISDRIGRRLKLHDLHVLMAVTQAGSMSKGAALLNTTQPAVSRSIADLERTLGVRLLDRNTQGVEPTEFGRALLDGGVAVFDDLRQALKNIEFLADPAAGEIRIGCTLLLAGSFVSAVVERLSRLHPRMQFHLVTSQETLHPKLRERNVDLLVGRRLGEAAAELDFEPLFEDSYVVVAGAKSPWARRRRITLAELMHEAWALPPPDNAIGSMAAAAFRAAGFDYPRASVFAAPGVLPSLMASGRFLTLVSTSVLKFLPIRPADYKILPVKLRMGRIPLGIITVKNRTLSPVARLFIEHARAVAKQITKPGEWYVV